MPLKNRYFLVSALVLLLALLAVVVTPFAISNGIRLWVWWAARQEGFIATIDKIDVPFLRPVLIGKLHLKSTRDHALRVDLTATDTSIGLNFKRVFLHMRGHIVRNLSIRELRVELHRSNPNLRAMSQSGWETLQRLLPENLNIANLEMRVENGPTLILLRGGFLSANETEAGRFSAAEVMIASPWFRQTFSQLRGASHWEANRLTLAGLTLSRGLDLQSATADLSRLDNQRVGLQFEVDAFGGKIRGDISHEWRSPHSSWKIAGGASDISLAQTSDAFGFTDRVNGALRACNFTFLGTLGEPERVTASLWAEVTGLTWRNRTAEAIMLGAALYSRKIQLQQLYIKQKTNQLTLSGEAALPANSSGWLSPDFRGNISASINQLGDFAALFGANPDDFSGKITIEGAMDTRDRKFGGHLAIEGGSLTFFKTAIDSLSAKLNLKATELEIEQFEMKRKNDSISGTGKIDLSRERNYSGTLDARADNLLDYLSGFRGSTGKSATPIPVDVHSTITASKWNARGIIHVPDSSPISFTANFPLRIGTDWSAFQLSPLNVTLDFPSIFLGKTPQIFHPEIFQDGILSGSISLSETLKYPRIVGDVSLIDGKLQNAFSNLTVLGGRVTFDERRASIDFLNASTGDASLFTRGEIDFEDTDAVAIKLFAIGSIVDLTPREPLGCISNLKVLPFAGLEVALLPIDCIELRGSAFRADWTIALIESRNKQPFGALDGSDLIRTFRFCSANQLQGQMLVMGGEPRIYPSTGHQRKRAKDR